MACKNGWNGKKLLILAGADVHCKVVRAAKEMGVYTIVTDYLSIEDSPAKQIADEAWMLDIRDVDAIAERCRKENVDGVLSFCIDPAQIPYQQICEKLEVPCYGTREQFEIMTNKRRFKDYCKRQGVDVVSEYTEEDIKTGNITYPVLVKPESSRGSRGQTICNNRGEMPEAIAFARRESDGGGVIIERYMQGKQDFSLAYIVIDSVPYLLKIGDRYCGKAEDNLDRQQICTMAPSRSAVNYMKCVEPKVRKLISSLGIRFGAFFLQGFLEEDRAYFYDPGLRFPGSDFDIVLKHATGFDSMKTMVRFALTGDAGSCEGRPEGVYDLNGSVCMILSIAVRPGKIKVFEGVERLWEDSRVLSVSRRYSAGETVPDTGDLKRRVAEVTACLSKRQEAFEFAQWVYQTLRILDENDRDMIVSKMGVDIAF